MKTNRPPRLKTREAPTLRACLQFLQLNGIAAWRVNTQGIADIIGIAPSRTIERPGIGPVTLRQPTPLAVEVKSQDGRQSVYQRQFQEEWERAGGLYVLARNVDDLGQALSAAGVRGAMRSGSVR